MSKVRLRIWAVVAIALGVALFIIQALIGLNYYGEGEPYPWFLRAVQWVALALVLVSVPMLMWALGLGRPSRRDV
jgi:uncharacterized membrane protein